ncbi:helix-turn-helix domain-containing protein [Streptomyces sp. NPDC088763]|uniref:helix-turn-helix domain-containing protein n=1 Tax=Streptomyces sp. NPDC088763 TaxID=3365892 RepID=UPI0038257E46
MPPEEALPEPVRSGQQTSAPSVVANAFALLRVLAAMRGPVGVTRLAAAVGIPKTTAHRLLEQLSAEGAVERHAGKWRIGPGILELSGFDPSSMLAATARPRLEALSRATGATLFLHRYTHGELDTVCQAFGAQVGLHVSAAQQHASARHPESAIWRALERGRLSAEYGRVRAECNCIAVPFSASGTDVAVLSLARPTSHELESLKRPLERMATLIGSDLRNVTK